jgi:hypothetical protein
VEQRNNVDDPNGDGSDVVGYERLHAAIRHQRTAPSAGIHRQSQERVGQDAAAALAVADDPAHHRYARAFAKGRRHYLAVEPGTRLGVDSLEADLNNARRGRICLL